MRIAFIVNNYPPNIGGLELHVQALASTLREQGHEPLVVALGDTPETRNDDGVEVLVLPQRFKVGGLLGFPHFGTKRRLKRLLKARQIEVVSVHTRFFPMSYLGWRAARSLHIPVVHTEHGSDHVASDSPVIWLGSRMVDFTLGRTVLRGADRVLGVSEEVTSFVYRLARVRAEVFYNAILPVPRSSEPLADRPGRFVFVGRLVPGKGWDTFLDAMAQLRAEGLDVTGEVLGTGPDEDQARQMVRDLHLENAVAVRGRVSQPEVRAALRGATLVNPTILSEGFQTTLLEAIAERGRVITYPIAGAETLRAQGEPVSITERRDVDSLCDAARAFLAAPPELARPELIDEWTWPVRAKQFIRVCTSLTAA